MQYRMTSAKDKEILASIGMTEADVDAIAEACESGDYSMWDDSKVFRGSPLKEEIGFDMEKEWCKCALTLDRDSMQVYKGLVGDLSALRGKSPSYTTFDCVLSKVSGEQKSRELVTTVYQAEQPNCLVAYDTFFTDLSKAP